MTLAEFSNVFALLAVQLRFTDADEVTIRGYFEALKDLEPEFLALAAQRLARQVNVDGEAWFPKTGEWRAMTAKVEGDRWFELHATLRKLRDSLCLDCRDTGFVLNAETNRVSRCPCQKLRRLEVLGRRPWPQLPAAESESDTTQLAKVEAATEALAHSRGMR